VCFEVILNHYDMEHCVIVSSHRIAKLTLVADAANGKPSETVVNALASFGVRCAIFTALVPVSLLVYCYLMKIDIL